MNERKRAIWFLITLISGIYAVIILMVYLQSDNERENCDMRSRCMAVYKVWHCTEKNTIFLRLLKKSACNAGTFAIY